MGTSLSRSLLFIWAASLISTPSNVSAELLTTWTGNEIERCMSGNTISVPGQKVCLRKMSNSEVAAFEYYTRLSSLKRAEREADKSVQRGFDPSVSLGEFRKRLDKQSEIQEKIMDMKY